MNVKEFMTKRTVGWYLFAASALCGLLTLIVYAARGGDVLTKLAPAAIVLLVVGVLLNAALLVKDVRPLELAPFVLYLAAFAVFMASEITFIGNVINGVDGNALDGGFVCVALFGLVSVGLGMAACILKIEKE